jgi:hypothetical protein
MSPYDINLLTAERAKLVTGPVVTSDRITSRKGPAITDKNNKNWIQEIKVTIYINWWLTYQGNDSDPSHKDLQSGLGHPSSR